MATFTTRLGLRKPAGTELYSVTEVNDNNDKIDAAVSRTSCTSTTRPSVPFAGQAIFETDTKNCLTYNGTAWVHESVPVVAATSAILAPYTGQRIVLSTDNRVYRYTGTVWELDQEKPPFAHAGITAGFIAISAANGAYPALVSQAATNGMVVSSSSITVPKAGLYEITAKGYFTAGTGYQGQWGATINSTALPPLAIASGLGMMWKGDSNDYTGWSTVRRTLAANDVIRLYMKSTGSTWGTDGYNGSWLEVLYICA